MHQQDHFWWPFSYFSPDYPLYNGHIFNYCCEFPVNFLALAYFTIPFSVTLLHIFSYCATSSFVSALHAFTSQLYFTVSFDYVVSDTSWVPFLHSSLISSLPFTSLLPSTSRLILLFMALYASSYCNKHRLFICVMSLSTTLDIYTPFPIHL